MANTKIKLYTYIVIHNKRKEEICVIARDNYSSKLRLKDILIQKYPYDTQYYFNNWVSLEWN